MKKEKPTIPKPPKPVPVQLKVPQSLHNALKHRAVDAGVPMCQYILEALEKAVGGHP
jgi:predicted DNA binding CopG/RHH family protein